MKYSINKWYLYLATLCLPLTMIGFIIFRISMAGNDYMQLMSILLLGFSIMGILAHCTILYSFLKTRNENCVHEILYAIFSFICMIPLYFISGFLFAECFHIHLV